MLIYLDTEATGTRPDVRLCQTAFKLEDGEAVCELFNPGKPISINGMAVHHITNKMVGDKPLNLLEALFNRIHAKMVSNGLKNPVQKMTKIRNNPILIPRMPFGKHKGMLFSEVPRDYLEWLSGTELDEDMAYTVKHHLWQL